MLGKVYIQFSFKNQYKQVSVFLLTFKQKTTRPGKTLVVLKCLNCLILIYESAASAFFCSLGFRTNSERINRPAPIVIAISATLKVA